MRASNGFGREKTRMLYQKNHPLRATPLEIALLQTRHVAVAYHRQKRIWKAILVRQARTPLDTHSEPISPKHGLIRRPFVQVQDHVWPVKINPVKTVLLPFAQCPFCDAESSLAHTQINSVAVNNESSWMAAIPRCTNGGVCEFESRLRLDEFADPFIAWFLEEVHQPSMIHGELTQRLFSNDLPTPFLSPGENRFCRSRSPS